MGGLLFLRESGDVVVGDLGHHAGRHVEEIVTVQQPAAWIVGIEGNGHAAMHWHQNGVAHGTAYRLTIDCYDLEMVPVQVHRVSHHTLIDHLQNDPLPF